LVEPADHQHGQTVSGRRFEFIAALGQVVTNAPLAGVLSAAAEDDVGSVEVERLTWVDIDHFHLVPAPLQPFLQCDDVSRIAVGVHFLRVQVGDRQGTHRFTDPMLDMATA